MKMVVGIYKEPESGAYGSPLGAPFPITPNPYSMELLDEYKIISKENLDILNDIKKAAKKAKESVPVTYKDKDGVYHLVTKKEMDSIDHKEDAITSDGADNLKQFVEAFKGRVSPSLEERLAKVGIKRV